MEYANADEYSREGRTIFLGREADDAIGLFRGKEREMRKDNIWIYQNMQSKR